MRQWDDVVESYRTGCRKSSRCGRPFQHGSEETECWDDDVTDAANTYTNEGQGDDREGCTRVEIQREKAKLFNKK